MSIFLFNTSRKRILLSLFLLLGILALGNHFITSKLAEQENSSQDLKPRSLILSDMAVSRENSSFKITWPAAEGATSYTLYRGTSDNFEDAEKLAANLKTTSFEDTNLEQDTAYSYFVQACELDSCSIFAKSLSRVLVSEPTSLKAKVYDSAIYLTWDTHPQADSYKIFRNTKDSFQDESLISTERAYNIFVDRSIEPDTSYYYFIQACNQNNCTQAKLAQNFHVKKPAKPAPVKAQALNRSQTKKPQTKLESKFPAEPISLSELFGEASQHPIIANDLQIASNDTNPFEISSPSSASAAELIDMQQIALVEDEAPALKTELVKPVAAPKPDKFYFGIGASHGTSHRGGAHTYKATYQEIDIGYGGEYLGFHGFLGYEFDPNHSIQVGLQHLWKQEQKDSICTDGTDGSTIDCNLEASIQLTSLYAMYQYQHKFNKSFGLRAGIGPSLNFMGLSVKNTKEGYRDVELEYESGTSFGFAMKLAMFYNNFELNYTHFSNFRKQEEDLGQIEMGAIGISYVLKF